MSANAKVSIAGIRTSMSSKELPSFTHLNTKELLPFTHLNTKEPLPFTHLNTLLKFFCLESSTWLML